MVAGHYSSMSVFDEGLVGDLQLGTEEGGEFGDKLFHRIGVLAEALPKLPVAARLGRIPARELVAQRRIVGFRRRAGR
jgi:hypothetical protein